MFRAARALGRLAVGRGVRAMGHAPATPASGVTAPAGVHVPETVEDLIWLLDQPPNLHEFEEPPVSLIS